MLRSRQRVAKEHRYRHRPHAARHRRHQAGHFEHGRIDVADEAGLRAVHRDVDDGRARFHHLGRHEPWSTHGGDENVGAACVARSTVREWQIVTVACSASSSIAIGLPTISLRR